MTITMVLPITILTDVGPTDDQYDGFTDDYYDGPTDDYHDGLTDNRLLLMVLPITGYH